MVAGGAVSLSPRPPESTNFGTRFSDFPGANLGQLKSAQVSRPASRRLPKPPTRKLLRQPPRETKHASNPAKESAKPWFAVQNPKMKEHRDSETAMPAVGKPAIPAAQEPPPNTAGFQGARLSPPDPGAAVK